ncbi:unnamed protein product [Effrenium voratum]|nr:unnamed protein product [Effrenium voratum]
MTEHPLVIGECPDAKRQPWSKRRGTLLALGAGIAAILSVAWRAGTSDYGDRFDPATLTAGDLLRMFMETKEYLYATGWREEGGTFVPRTSQRLGEPKASAKLEMKRYYSRVSKKNACGAGMRDVLHMTAVLPAVNVSDVMEALTNPAYTNWNPSLHEVQFRRHRRLPLSANLRDTFTPEEMQTKGGYSTLAFDRDSMDVAAQVAEVALPRFVQRAAGRRFTSDFIAVRFDCKANRGFSIATSVGTEAVAEAAGTRKMQEICLTSLLLAPSPEDGNDTLVHIVSHFDPQVRSAMLQKAVQLAVGRSTRLFLQALHKKAPSPLERAEDWEEAPRSTDASEILNLLRTSRECGRGLPQEEFCDLSIMSRFEAAAKKAAGGVAPKTAAKAKAAVPSVLAKPKAAPPKLTTLEDKKKFVKTWEMKIDDKDCEVQAEANKKAKKDLETALKKLQTDETYLKVKEEIKEMELQGKRDAERAALTASKTDAKAATKTEKKVVATATEASEEALKEVETALASSGKETLLLRRLRLWRRWRS